jgi:hypothetical protein
MTINRLNQGVTNQVLVKAVSGQTTPLLELQDSTGAVVSSIGPTGALGGTLGNSGLVHINTTSFSVVAEQQINDVFSSTYDNYRIMGYVSAASQSVFMRMRTSTTDSGSNYGFQNIEANNTTVTANRSTSTSSWQVSNTASSQNQGFVIDLQNPNIAMNTYGYMQHNREADGTLRMTQYVNNLLTATQYTGFVLFPSSSNISGTVSVYGYAKA